MKDAVFHQCKLVKTIGRVRITTTSWLPIQYAVVGKHLDLKDGKWERGWVVEYVGSIALSEDAILNTESFYRQHRLATDI